MRARIAIVAIVLAGCSSAPTVKSPAPPATTVQAPETVIRTDFPNENPPTTTEVTGETGN